jgi:hypothetical protein
MGFVDALIEHAEVRVAMVDRRDGVGGHWRHACSLSCDCTSPRPLRRGVACVLGGGRIQTEGPEAGLHERADPLTICAYYEQLLAERMVGPGRVEFFPRCDYVGGRAFGSRESGERFQVPDRCRVVDARYLAPDFPAETPPNFEVAEGVRVNAVNDLPTWEGMTSRYVIVGSGKTATDACVWLLGRGVDPDAICWVRPRDPWMLNRSRSGLDDAVGRLGRYLDPGVARLARLGGLPA